MKVLVFHIGPDRYGLPLAAIARVLPVAALKQVPLAPAWVAGLLDLQGQPVPVIDLSLLAGAAPGPLCYDSRIVLVDYATGDGQPRALGLLAAQVAAVAAIDAAALAAAGVEGARFLGPVATLDGCMQLVDVDRLLPPAVHALLFQPQAAPA